MSLTNRIVAYLKKKPEQDVPASTVFALANKAGFDDKKVWSAIHEIENSVANVGYWKDYKTGRSYFRYYEPDDLTNKVQECLDRGDDW